MSYYESEKYYDDPFEAGEVDWSHKDNEGYYAEKLGDDF